MTILPAHWRLVPVNHQKQPFGYNWQHNSFSPSQLAQSLSQTGTILVQGKHNTSYPVQPDGIGLLCGQNSQEYLISVDCDGFSAYQKLKEISRCDRLPTTVAFTSTRPGRCQYLFKIPNPTLPLKSRRLPTIQGEILEIRGARMQSILPPSPHPLTGQYQWVSGCRPDQVEVAIAPDWLIELMLYQRNPDDEWGIGNGEWGVRLDKNPTNYLSKAKSSANRSIKLTIAQAKLLLSVIHPQFADDYHHWIMTGLCLKAINDNLLPEWDSWSQLSPKYKPCECAYKWSGFKGIGPSIQYLINLANQS